MPLHKRAVDHTVAAVITVEGDLRFLGDTMHAVLNQTVLPGTVIVADCTGLTGQPVHSEVPLRDGEPDQALSIQIVRAAGARSFFDAVMHGLKYARLERAVSALWTLHDDSRPADACLEALLEARRCSVPNSWTGAGRTCITWDRMPAGIIWNPWWWTANRTRSSMTAGRMCSPCPWPAR